MEGSQERRLLAEGIARSNTNAHYGLSSDPLEAYPMYPRPTLKDVREALERIKTIPRPYGDNEGDPINSNTVFPELSPEYQLAVSHAQQVCSEYTRTLDGRADRRAVGHITRAGYRTSLGPSQYEADRLVGSVNIEDWTLDISDSSSENDESY